MHDDDNKLLACSNYAYRSSQPICYRQDGDSASRGCRAHAKKQQQRQRLTDLESARTSIGLIKDWGLPSELGAGVPFNLRSDCELFLRFQVLNALGVSLNDFRPQATTRDFCLLSGRV